MINEIQDIFFYYENLFMQFLDAYILLLELTTLPDGLY
jgi:hypothetical protein